MANAGGLVQRPRIRLASVTTGLVRKVLIPLILANPDATTTEMTIGAHVQVLRSLLAARAFLIDLWLQVRFARLPRLPRNHHQR